MDVSTLRAVETAAIHVKNAAGEPLYDGEKPVRIVLHSPGSKAFGAIESRQTARALRRMNDADGKLTAPSAEDRLAESAEDLAAVTVAFEGLSCGDKIGTELFQAVYGDPALGFIAQQVTKALKDWSLFSARLSDRLSLFARHLAWLNATPKPPPGSKRAKVAEPKEALSRAARMKKDGISPAMPSNPLPHIISRLVEMGLTEAAGMGAAPLSWLTIEAWQRSTGVDLSPWEVRLIRRLSADYVAESRRAESETCPPPFRAEVTQRERDTEVARLRMVLG